MQDSILVIDDDEDDCEFVRDCLYQIGIRMTVNFAYDGPTAFKLLENSEISKPKLIILDLNMPVMNGLAVLKKLNEQYTIPVLLYSTFCDDDLVQQSKALGAIDCMKKGTSYTDNLKFAKRVMEILRDFGT
jgi:CheY-like chemotaxis protein